MSGKYRVYFSQVNQEFYDVMAKSKQGAIIQATKEWRKENGWPELITVETPERDED